MTPVAILQSNANETGVTINPEDQESISARKNPADASSQEDHIMVTAKNESFSRLLALYCMPMLELREAADGRRFVTVRKHNDVKPKDWNVVAAWLNEELASGYVDGVPVKAGKRKNAAALDRLVAALEGVLADSAGGDVIAMPVAGEHGRVNELH